jgi:hypothetical protein
VCFVVMYYISDVLYMIITPQISSKTNVWHGIKNERRLIEDELP